MCLQDRLKELDFRGQFHLIQLAESSMKKTPIRDLLVLAHEVRAGVAKARYCDALRRQAAALVHGYAFRSAVDGARVVRFCCSSMTTTAGMQSACVALQHLGARVARIAGL